jgi:hypothetical protein
MIEIQIHVGFIFLCALPFPPCLLREGSCRPQLNSILTTRFAFMLLASPLAR